MNSGERRSNRARERRDLASRLEILNGLLNTLIDVLDIREVFDQISQVVQGVLPHDLMGILEISEAGDRIRLHAATHKPTPTYEAVVDPQIVMQTLDANIVEDFPNHPLAKGTPALKAGMVTVLSAPIRFGGRLQAVVNFFSRQPGWFTREDLPIAERIASHIALAMSHHRLAEEARERQALEAHASKLNLLDQSLASLTETGDLKDLFDRISAVARQVLPHDALALPVLLPDGRARRYATSGLNVSDIPEALEVPPGFVRDPDWEYDVIDDVTRRLEPLNVLVAKMGFISILRVPLRLDGRFAAVLAFMSRCPGFYKQRDVQIARRIADRLALGLERERSVEEARRADSATARAAQLESRVRQLTEELDTRAGYRRLIGESSCWRDVLKHAAQVSSVETTVLLLGETGTGKEVVARFVHRGSARKDGPFVALNCAALPENLLESELFGHERGAFTGAMQSKPGLIEQAAGGVLFLDEVGEMALASQAKFLRVLQEREFQRLGGTRVLKADVRVIAATNRDLRKAIERGSFREDLYYRLNVFELRIPPLRERPGDILPLADAFVAEIGRSLGVPPAGISVEARQALVEYQWPGNVRELRNILERAAILAGGGLIVSEHLAFGPRTEPEKPLAMAKVTEKAEGPGSSAASDLSSVERTMIKRAMEEARFNKSIAAKKLGLTRAQLYTRLKRYGLE